VGGGSHQSYTTAKVPGASRNNPGGLAVNPVSIRGDGAGTAPSAAHIAEGLHSSGAVRVTEKRVTLPANSNQKTSGAGKDQPINSPADLSAGLIPQATQTSGVLQASQSNSSQQINPIIQNRLGLNQSRVSNWYNNSRNTELFGTTNVSASPNTSGNSPEFTANGSGIQVAVSTQVDPVPAGGQLQVRTALLRVENENSTGRAVVSEVSDGVRAAILPSSAEAVVLAQAQVPYLKETIASFGFAPSGVSVSVNPGGAGRGHENQEHVGNGRAAERSGAGTKLGEIFPTEEVS
jgi:hypothetical protein